MICSAETRGRKRCSGALPRATLSPMLRSGREGRASPSIWQTNDESAACSEGKGILFYQKNNIASEKGTAVRRAVPFSCSKWIIRADCTDKTCNLLYFFVRELLDIFIVL